MVTHNDINQIAVTNALFGQYIVVGVTFKRLKRKDFDWDREWRRNTRKKVWVSLGWALTLNNRIYSQDLLLVKKIERIWKFLFRLNGIEHLTWNLQRNTWEQSSNQKQMQHRVRSHFYSHLHSALRGATLRCFLPKSLESSQANLHTVQHPRLVRAQEEIAQMFGVTAKMKNQQPWGSLKNAGLEGNVEEGLPCSNQRNDMEWEGRRGALWHNVRDDIVNSQNLGLDPCPPSEPWKHSQPAMLKGVRHHVTNLTPAVWAPKSPTCNPRRMDNVKQTLRFQCSNRSLVVLQQESQPRRTISYHPNLINFRMQD